MNPVLLLKHSALFSEANDKYYYGCTEILALNMCLLYTGFEPHSLPRFIINCCIDDANLRCKLQTIS